MRHAVLDRCQDTERTADRTVIVAVAVRTRHNVNDLDRHPVSGFDAFNLERAARAGATRRGHVRIGNYAGLQVSIARVAGDVDDDSFSEFQTAPDPAALGVVGPGVIGSAGKSSEMRLARGRRREIQKPDGQRKAENANSSHNVSRRRPVQHPIEKRVRFGAVNLVRAVETGYAALLGNAHFTVKRGYPLQFDIDEAARLNLNGISGTDFDHQGARGYQRRQVGVVELVQDAEIEHIESVLVKEERCAFGEIGSLDVPVVEIAAADNGLETRLGRSGPKGGEPAVGQAVE